MMGYRNLNIDWDKQSEHIAVYKEWTTRFLRQLRDGSRTMDDIINHSRLMLDAMVEAERSTTVPK